MHTTFKKGCEEEVKIAQTTIHRPSGVKINHEPAVAFYTCFGETAPGTQSVK